MNKLKNTAKRLNRELATLFVLIVIVVIFSAKEPRYMDLANLIDIIEQAVINGFLAIGVTFAIITGGIDLSVGSIMAVAIVACGQLAVSGLPPVAVMGIGMLLGLALGSVNGLLITKMKLQPFIATLGTCSILRGVAYVITDGWPVLNIPSAFRSLFQNEVVDGVRMSMIYLLLMAVVFAFVLKRTRAGVYIYSIGSNEEATKLSGVNTDRYKIVAYALCGLASAMAGMVTLARLGTGEPTAGQGYELNAIAAAAIGGASLAGGKGSILGTVLGALTLSALRVGLVVIGMDTFYQYIATGLIIVVAVYFEVMKNNVIKLASRRRQLRQRTSPATSSGASADKKE
ncbi:ABC transporter permease [Bacilliculturomica massiliensis]|uniref:ABC transporter permease n=1 Tax=Bacilliculturomica massiliensis TaxID=1917867 RepID=UPI0010305C27|nr:ABC transporter permease [Bacilliculturomica massiliensis]